MGAQREETISKQQWNQLMKKVIDPLWNQGFKTRFAAVKLDYDDFVSLAGYELAKAWGDYNVEKSSIYTFAYNIITNKANTMIRNMNRDKRRADAASVSFNTPVCGDEHIMLGDTLADDSYNAADDSYTARVCQYLRCLSNDQKNYLFLRVLGVNEDEIAIGLGFTKEKMRRMLNSMSLFHKTNILRRSVPDEC